MTATSGLPAAVHNAELAVGVERGMHDSDREEALAANGAPRRGLRRAIQRQPSGANLEIVAGTGHLLPHERPDALRELLANVESTWLRPAAATQVRSRPVAWRRPAHRR